MERCKPPGSSRISISVWLQEWKTRRDARRIDSARRAGVGTHLGQFSVEPTSAPTILLEWCRQTMATSRRPWGIDRFDLTVVVSDGAKRSTKRFRKLAPMALYDGSLANRLVDAFGDLMVSRVQVETALCSWGDLTYEVLVRGSSRTEPV